MTVNPDNNAADIRRSDVLLATIAAVAYLHETLAK
jgi:hypothetical protein